jgi:NAD-dependent SIR2 family protein deacetylase
MTALFCQMIGQLADMSQSAEPTPFHRLLKTLDSRGKLLRVYTQNIDCLEKKADLSFGVPEFEDRRRARTKTPPTNAPGTNAASTSTLPQSKMIQSKLPSPPPDPVPRCVPLHGHVEAVHCLNCSQTFDAVPHIDTLKTGSLPTCPACESLDDIRQQEGKRSRGIGKLRPSVVLYNEVHMSGEGVGEAVRRDLVGSSKAGGRGADLLLVVGTSLKVPGTKRIVREFSRALHARGTGSQLPTPESSPSPSPTVDETGPVRTIYLNLDFPVPNREWEGVFDVWVNGDAQTFAHHIGDELRKADVAKQVAEQKKAEREMAAKNAKVGPSKPKATKTPAAGTGGGTKRKTIHVEASQCTQPTKKRKVASSVAKDKEQHGLRVTTTFKAAKVNASRAMTKGKPSIKILPPRSVPSPLSSSASSPLSPMEAPTFSPVYVDLQSWESVQMQRSQKPVFRENNSQIPLPLSSAEFTFTIAPTIQPVATSQPPRRFTRSTSRATVALT